MKKLFDIPRLKIGSSKRDDEDGESQPPTPKSVVPALSPRADYELRTACALVLQDFKPSDYVYHERFGDDGDDGDLDYKTQLNYAAFMQALDDDDDEPETPLDPVTTRVGPVQSESKSPAAGKPIHSKTSSGQKFTGGLWDRVREEHGMDYDESEPESELPLPPAQPKAVPVRRKMAAHKRSFSQPLPNLTSISVDNITERPKSTALRAYSHRTAGSTPQTDGTDFGLNSSTAPTTAPATPGYVPTRPYKHPWQFPPTHGDGKINEVDGDWIRRELERHRQTQEETKAQMEREETESHAPRTTLVAVEDGVLAPRIIARKPVPKSTTVSVPNAAARRRSSSRQSAEISRSASRNRRSTPRSESRAELEMLRPESQQEEGAAQTAPAPEEEEGPAMEAQPTPYRSRWRRPGTRAPAPSGVPSEAPSRSRSLTRQFSDFIRTGSRGPSRKQSVEISRPGSRSRSIDSVRSAVSAISNTDYSSGRWNSWRPFRKNSEELSRSDSFTSKTSDGNGKSSSKSKKKPINLNRELPPLPSLDQWKDEEPEPPVPNTADIALFAMGMSPMGYSYDTTDSPPPKRSLSKHQRTPSQPKRTPSHLKRNPSQSKQYQSINDESSPPPTREPARTDNTLRIQPKRVSSLGAPRQHPTSELPRPAQSNGTSLPSSPGVVEERTINMIAMDTPPEPAEQAPPPPATQNEVKPGPTPNSRFSTPVRKNSFFGKRSSSFSPFPSSNSRGMSMDQSRTTPSDSQPNFSRKLSTDDYNRNQLGQSPAADDAKDAPTVPPKDKSKKRWWQSGRAQKRAISWVDSAMKSSPRSEIEGR